MRNVFLALVLANLLLLAWQFWISPESPAPPAADAGGLELFAVPGRPSPAPKPARPGAQSALGPGTVTEPQPGACLRLGPLPSPAAAQQAGARLAAQGIEALPISLDTQLWLGHLVQIGGFASVASAEVARQRLIAGGLAEASLIQEGTQPALSLGVFRDRSRADRVVSDARALGFEPRLLDRYRPTVEQWLLIRPRPGQAVQPAIQSLAGDRIMRTEGAPCPGSLPPTEFAAPAEAAAAAEEAR